MSTVNTVIATSPRVVHHSHHHRPSVRRHYIHHHIHIRHHHHHHHQQQQQQQQQQPTTNNNTPPPLHHYRHIYTAAIAATNPTANTTNLNPHRVQKLDQPSRSQSREGSVERGLRAGSPRSQRSNSDVVSEDDTDGYTRSGAASPSRTDDDEDYDGRGGAASAGVVCLACSEGMHVAHTCNRRGRKAAQFRPHHQAAATATPRHAVEESSNVDALPPCLACADSNANTAHTCGAERNDTSTAGSSAGTSVVGPSAGNHSTAVHVQCKMCMYPHLHEAHTCKRASKKRADPPVRSNPSFGSCAR
jgi:hypothetical protein